MVRPPYPGPVGLSMHRSPGYGELRGGWRGPGGQFVRRVGCFAVLLAISIFILGAVTMRVLFGEDIVPSDEQGPPPHALLILIPFGLVMWAIYRSLRITAEPIGSVMAAAERVAEGDYGARVEPHGSPDVQQLITTFNAMTERLESHEQQRRMLLADIAHELRNPLAVIRGKVEGVIDGVYPPSEEQLQPLIDEIGHMTRLLDDLQTLSLAESGALSLRHEPISLSTFVCEVANASRARVEAAGLNLHVDAEGEDEIYADSFRLRQVIENLLSNAIRHTPSGGSIGIESRAGEHTARIDISDTGSGIPTNILPHIFDRFTKAADSGGSGLGLAIARRLVEAHGGRITVWSQEGIGTRITVTLPLEPARESLPA